MVDASTFCLTRTHTCHCKPEGLCDWCIPLRENVPSKSIRSISRSNRKNLAVHVSLSSIFTMSKSGPREPLSRATSWKQSFLIFGNRILLPVTRQQLCPFRNSLDRRAARPFVISEAGYRADPFRCQHSKMTKPTKSEIVGRPLVNPRNSGAFSPIVPVDER